MLANPSSINFSELSVAERKLLADYERIIRKSSVLTEHQVVQLLGAKAVLQRNNNGLQIETAQGAVVQLKHQGDRTVVQFTH